ncbi:uncharacterized protein N7498_008862 [Penicillium cinerascens]|uniref:Uncharacterized protein n=1 Tax=Penicillium cinerascens TaxID=70096 RepID=A0A9W9JFI1_9EURO|nr:uncharacterized protein N7498_008862 [Penicillium cinerascens]KAJ5195424.1 hypothetical protein N7498_008862 [Penicillium cinerascens]
MTPETIQLVDKAIRETLAAAMSSKPHDIDPRKPLHASGGKLIDYGQLIHLKLWDFEIAFSLHGQLHDERSFLIKVISRELGHEYDQGYALLPLEFPEVIDDMPDTQKFAALSSKLHQKNASPTGSFGFHVTIYAGNLTQFVASEDSWETFFAKTMRQALGLEIEREGPSEELDVLSRSLFERVIPSPLTRWSHMNVSEI